MATDSLVTYMNDHLAGSRTALQLLDDLMKATSDGEMRAFLDGVRADIAEDRETLENLIRRIGGAPSVVRDVGGWVAEKLSWLKLALDDPSNGPLRRLEALEILALGIEGKGGLWRALAMAAPDVPALAGVNFGELVQRATEQHARVEARRIEAARVAFMRQGDVSATTPPAAED